MDRKNKEDYINSLNKDDYNTLMEQLENHPELKDILDLDVVEVNE